MYHAELPYEYCKRTLANGETVSIKYRKLNERYGDSVLADPNCPEEQGMDQAIKVHDARFSYDREDIIKFALKEFEQVPRVSMNNPIFMLHRLDPLSDPGNMDGNEDTNEEDVTRAKRWMNQWLVEDILGSKVVQTADDLPEFQEEITSFPNEVIVS